MIGGTRFRVHKQQYSTRSQSCNKKGSQEEIAAAVLYSTMNTKAKKDPSRLRG